MSMSACEYGRACERACERGHARGRAVRGPRDTEARPPPKRPRVSSRTPRLSPKPVLQAAARRAVHACPTQSRRRGSVPGSRARRERGPTQGSPQQDRPCLIRPPCAPERGPQPSHRPCTSLRQGAGPTRGALGVGAARRAPKLCGSRDTLPRGHGRGDPRREGRSGGPLSPLPSPRAPLCWSPPCGPGPWVSRAHGAQPRGRARGSHGGTGSGEGSRGPGAAGASSHGPPGLGRAPGRPPAASHSHEVGRGGRPRVGPGSAGLWVPRAPTPVPVRKGTPWSPAFGGPHCIWGAGGWRGLRGSRLWFQRRPHSGGPHPAQHLEDPAVCPGDTEAGESITACPRVGGTQEPRGRAKKAVTAPAHGSSGRPPLRPSRCRSPGKGPPRSRRKTPLVTRISEPLGLPGKAHFFSERHKFLGAVNGFSLFPAHQLTARHQILN